METLTPYAQGLAGLTMGGWPILPLPERAKNDPPAGFTGSRGKVADEELTHGLWLDETGHNIGLRLPQTLVGLDIDNHPQKPVEGKRTKDTGKLTLSKLQSKLGMLPPTFTITNRDEENFEDGYTMFFIIPSGLKLEQSAGDQIDIIQWGHRYQVAPPSVHPDGRIYRWADIKGRDIDFIPEVDCFPELPQAWVEYLTKKVKAPKEIKEPFIEEEELDTSDFFTGEKACSYMGAIVNRHRKELTHGEVGRHDLGVLAAWAMVCEAWKGHRGIEEAKAAYKQAWFGRFLPSERLSRPLEAEFESLFKSAMRKQVGNPLAECKCSRMSKARKPKQYGSTNRKMFS